MNSTVILIVLGVLILLVFVYFVAKKRADLAMLRELTGPRSSIMDRLVGEYVNLPPGTLVQRSGNYECILCAKGGFQDAWAGPLLGEEEARHRAQARLPSRAFFEKGSKLPACPNCGDAAGWTLVKQ